MVDIKCNDDVQLALKHMQNDEYELGIKIFKKYEGCHKTNFTCPYYGDDCAIQDLIAGFTKAHADKSKN